MSGERRKIGPQIILFYAACFVLLITDQLSKAFVVELVPLGDTIPFIENIFHITLVYNTGAAFGMLKGVPIVFTVISILAAIFINYMVIKYYARFSRLEISGLCLILAGTLGNLVDRLRVGHVIDFLDFRVWPVFNIADTWITIGAVVLGLGIFFGHRGKV